MDDYISRDAVLEIIQRTFGDYATALSEVGKLPSADMRCVTYCADCIHFDVQEMECKNNEVVTDNEGGADFSINFGPDDFCSYGERRCDNAAG